MSASVVGPNSNSSNNNNSNNSDEFDEVEESLLSYKRFTKRLRHTIVNPFFIGASFAVGLSIGFAIFDWSAAFLRAHPPLDFLKANLRFVTQ